MKKRKAQVCKHSKNPKTGEVKLKEDLTAKSTAFSKKELISLIKKGVVGKELGEILIKRIQHTEEEIKGWLKFLKTNPSKKQKNEYLKSQPLPSFSKVKKEMEVHKWILDNKDYLLSVLGKKKTKKYRQAGHLLDEKLKYKNPKRVTPFSKTCAKVQQKIEESKTEISAEGIKLTSTENKLVHAINQILHEKSQTKNAKEEDFYGGNQEPLLVRYGPNSRQKAAVLRFKPSELYKAYVGADNYSGADISFINKILYQLADKKFFIKYDRIKKIKKGGKEETLTDRIEDFQALIKIVSFIPNLTEEEKAKLDKGDSSIRKTKGEIILGLNPIFNDQIDTKFIEFPINTNRRLVIAAGGHKKVTSSMQILMEWFLRDLSAKRYKIEINEEKLPYILGLDKYVKQKRSKKLQERISKDIQAVTNVGIILQSDKVPNSTGSYKWVFHLNKNYS